MTPCDGTQNSDYWCCGADNTGCCATEDAIRIDRLFAQSVSNQSTSIQNGYNQTTSSQHAWASNESTFSDGLSNQNLSNHNGTESERTASGLSPGIKGAIGGSIAAAAVLVFAFVLYALTWRKRGGESPEFPIFKAKGPVELGQSSGHEIGPGNMLHEKSTGLSDTRYEIGSGEMRYEKPAGSPNQV